MDNPRVAAQLIAMVSDIAEIKTGVKYIEKELHGNGKAGVFERLERLERHGAGATFWDVVRPHMRGIIRMGVLFFLAVALGAYALVWAIAHQWPRLP